MNYAVLVTDHVRRYAEGLPAEMKQLFVGAHTILSENPHKGHAMVGRLEGLRRFKAGPFRLVYEVDEKRRTLTILMISWDS